jgi:hypothetical protein
LYEIIPLQDVFKRAKIMIFRKLLRTKLKQDAESFVLLSVLKNFVALKNKIYRYAVYYLLLSIHIKIEFGAFFLDS